MVLGKLPVPGRPTNCPPTLVEGDYSNGFVRPSVGLVGWCDGAG